MRRNTNEGKRIRRSLGGNAESLTRVHFEEAALRGIKDLDSLWQQTSDEQRRAILENDNLAALLKSIIDQSTDTNLAVDVVKWFNQRIDNSQRKVIYSKIFKDIIKFFISQNYVEGLHFIKQGMGDKWNNEFTGITLDIFLPTIMSLESPKTMLSWFKLNVSNPEMVQSIDRIIDILSQTAIIKAKAEELKGKISSDTERVTNAIARANSDPTQENIAELLQIINTVCEAADIESDAQTLKEYQSTIVDFAERLRVKGVENYASDVKGSMEEALMKHSEFTHRYKNNLPKLTNHLEQLVRILNKERDIRAKLDEVMSNTEDYSVVRTSKVIEHCVQEMGSIDEISSNVKAKIRRDIGLQRAQSTLGVSLSEILKKISEGILQLGPSIDFVDEWNENFKLIKNECIKLNINLMSLYPELKKDLERQSSSDLLQLRDLVRGEHTSTVEQLSLMQSMLSDLRFVLSERPIMSPDRVFIAKIIKKLELQLETFNEIKLKFQDVLKFTSTKQIERNSGDFIAKIRALKQSIKSIDKRALLKEAIENDSNDITKSIIESGVVLDDEIRTFAKEHGSSEMSFLINSRSLQQKFSTIRNKVLDTFDGCSSAKRRRKREPCSNIDLEEKWQMVKNWLQEQVGLISRLQAQLTESESFVRIVYDNINSFAGNLHRGLVIDLETTIGKFKTLSTEAKKSSIRHDGLQKEVCQDILDEEVVIQRIKERFIATEIYHSNQNDFDSIFNSIEQGLAGLNQKIEDYSTRIGYLESSISNFDSLISRTEAALPIFREVKIISIRVGSRLESLPHNSNNRALLSLDHQRDMARLEELKQSIQEIQDVPQGVKDFLTNEVDETGQKAAQLSSCLQPGGRGKRAAGRDCYTTPEDFNSIMNRKLDKIQSDLEQLLVKRLDIHDRLTFTLRQVEMDRSLEKMYERLQRSIGNIGNDLGMFRRDLNRLADSFNELVGEVTHHEMTTEEDFDYERMSDVSQEITSEIDRYNDIKQGLDDTRFFTKRLDSTIKLVEEAKSVKVRLDHYTQLLKDYYDGKVDAIAVKHGLQDIQEAIAKIELIRIVIVRSFKIDIRFTNQGNADRGAKRIEQYQWLIDSLIPHINADHSEFLRLLDEKLPLEASQPIRDQITKLKTVIASLKKLQGDLTDIKNSELENLPDKVAMLCEIIGAGRGKRDVNGNCEIIDEMNLEEEGRVESIESISSNLNRYILERLTIKHKIVKIVKHLSDLDGVNYSENINDIELLLNLQNSYLDSVSSAIDLHRSENRHNGVIANEETEQRLNRLELRALESREQNAGLMSSVTALKGSIPAFEKIRKIKERLNPELLKDLSEEGIGKLIDNELVTVEIVKKIFIETMGDNVEHTIIGRIKNKFDQEVLKVDKKVSDIQYFASLMQEIDRFDSRKKSLYESTRSMNSEGITYGKKINDLRDELFSNIVGLIDDFNGSKLDPNLIEQAPDFIKERVKVFKNDISYLKSVQAEVSTTKGLSIDELFNDISPSIRDYHTHGESLELSQVAMSYKRLRSVTYFLENGFDVNTRDSNGRTFLHLAAEMGSDESLISLLLEKGAMFDAKDNNGKSPLDLLRINTIKLDNKGVELLENIERAFHFVSNGDSNSVEHLLKESLEDYIRTLVKVKNSSGNTLLYEAVAKEQANQENQVKIIDLLIKNGAADYSQDPNGKSTLYIAIKNKGEKIIDFLLKKGAVVDDATIEFAKRNSNEAIVKKLEQHILDKFMQSVGSCSLGSSRVKREVSDCISWEDIDEFNEEKDESRNPEKIKIDSEKLLDYLKEVPVGKRSALIELVNKVGEERVVGRFQGVVNKLTSNQKAMGHLDKVGRVSGALMHGMMYKSLLGASLRGDLKGVATSSGFIILSHVSGKISEAAYSKGVALMIDGKVLLGRLSKIGGSVAGHIFVPFMVYSAVEDGIACKKGDSDSCVSLGGDVAFLATDAIGIGVEVAEAFGLIEGVLSVTGPIVAVIDGLIVVIIGIYSAVEEVENSVIRLTGWEKFIEGSRAFIGMNPEQYLQELVSEKQANNQLVKQALEFLKNNPSIQNYVLPTGKAVTVECHDVFHEEEVGFFCKNFPSFCGGGYLVGENSLFQVVKECTSRIDQDPDNQVFFDRKRDGISPSRARPDNPSEGELFCSPGKEGKDLSDTEKVVGFGPLAEIGSLLLHQSLNTGGDVSRNGEYFCKDAIGVQILTNRTGNNTLVNLGDGNDTIVGFPKSKHIVVLGDGHKNVVLGDDDDTVLLNGNNTSGIIDAGEGSDILDLRSFVPGRMLAYFPKYIMYQGEGSHVLRTESFENVLGRKGGVDKIYTGCETEYVDGRGGRSDSERDLVVIDNKENCSYKTQIVVEPSTDVENYSSNGTFGYIVNSGQGQANINLFGPSQHNFVFNYSLSEIESINKTKNRVTFSLGNLSAESRFNVTILEPTKGGQNVSYYFSDNSKVVFEGPNIFALQNTNRSISEVIDNALPIVNRLEIYFSAQSKRESIVIAHKNNDVIESNPNSVTYLIGGDGKNVYVINPGSKLPLPKVIIYDFDRENTGIDTIDFRKLLKKFGPSIKLKVIRDGNNLLLTSLDYRRMNPEIITVELRGGISWYKKVRVITENVSMKIELLPNSSLPENSWTITPLPLKFRKEHDIIYISTRDVLRNQEIIVDREAGEYKLLKHRGNLVITHEDKYSVIIENFFKNPVMQTLKVNFIDRRINLAGIDGSNITELNNIKDEHKKRIDTILNNFKTENTTTISENSTVSPGRQKRYVKISRKIGGFLPLYKTQTILLAPKKDDMMEVSLEEEILPEALEQPSVSNNISQSIGNGKSSVYKENIPSNIPSSASKPESWINAAVSTISRGIAAVFNSAQSFISNVDSAHVDSAHKDREAAVGFHDKFLGKLNEPRVQKICEELKDNFEEYTDGDIKTCTRNLAELAEDKCGVNSAGSSSICADQLLRQIEKGIDDKKQYNSRELAINFFNQDGNIQLLTYIIKWIFKIKSKDEDINDVEDEVHEAAYEVLREVEVCKVISKAISQFGRSINILEDDIYNSALRRIVINEDATKEEISEVLFSALEQLSEIKLNEGEKEESEAITLFIEGCKESKENILDTVAQWIIDYNSKLGEEERSHNMELYAELEQQGAEPIRDIDVAGQNLNIIGGPISSLTSLTQVTNVNARVLG